MPKVLKQPTTSVQAAQTQPVETARETTLPREVAGKHKQPKIWYPDITVNGVVIPRKNLKVTAALAKEFLGYETETQFKDRQTKANPAANREQFYFQPPDGDEKQPSGKPVPRYHFVDPTGEKVICWMNINNRPFDAGWGARISQDILTRAFLFNCQPIIITKTKLSADGQHRLLGLIFAVMEWGGKNAEYWRSIWPEEPYIETLVVCGADESAKVWMTLDNTKARTEAENFVTTDLIDWTAKSKERKECARYLQDAVSLLWTRTGAEGEGTFSRYRTHAVAMDFVSKHRTLLKCVKHLWEENTSEGRAISGLKLGISPGHCAAMMYLMASCRSDGDAYRHHVSTSERDESQLNMEELDRAKLFWSLLAASDPNVEGGNKEAIKMFKSVRKMTGLIRDPNYGSVSISTNGNKTIGSSEEIQALFAKAWASYLEHGTIEDAGVSLRYEEDREPSENGELGALKERWLDECPIFGGIDVGLPKKEARQPGMKTTKEQVEAGKKAERERKDRELSARLEASRKHIPQQTDNEKKTEQLRLLESLYPQKLLILLMPSGSLMAVGAHGKNLASITGFDYNDNIDPPRLSIAKVDAGEALGKVAAAVNNAILVRKETVPQGQPDQFSATDVRTGEVVQQVTSV